MVFVLILAKISYFLSRFKTIFEISPVILTKEDISAFLIARFDKNHYGLL